MTNEMSKDRRIAELETCLDAVRVTRDYFGKQAAKNADRADAAEATLAKVAALAKRGLDDDGRNGPTYALIEIDEALASAGRPSDGEGGNGEDGVK